MTAVQTTLGRRQTSLQQQLQQIDTASKPGVEPQKPCWQKKLSMMRTTWTRGFSATTKITVVPAIAIRRTTAVTARLLPGLDYQILSKTIHPSNWRPFAIALLLWEKEREEESLLRRRNLAANIPPKYILFLLFEKIILHVKECACLTPPTSSFNCINYFVSCRVLLQESFFFSKERGRHVNPCALTKEEKNISFVIFPTC